MTSKLNSEILSQDAKVRLQRDIERKRTDAQRWLQDMQAEFESKRQEGEAKFQESLEPIVRAVATENQIGLIIRATPRLDLRARPRARHKPPHSSEARRRPAQRRRATAETVAG